MTSKTTRAFRELLAALPARVRDQARTPYSQFLQDPRHPGLQFKPIHATRPIFAVRIGIHYRALGAVAGDRVVWFWIGHHSIYDRLVKQL